MNVRSSFLLLLFSLALLVVGSVAQTCANNDDESCTLNNDAEQQAQAAAADPRRTISINNLSKYRADIHYDDGRFGKSSKPFLQMENLLHPSIHLWDTVSS